MPEMRGVTVKIPADLHAEMKDYIAAHQLTIEQFINMAVENELHPKFQMKEEKPMGKDRTLAFQVSEEYYQRVKAYLKRHNGMKQNRFLYETILSALEQDEALYQSEQTEENAEGSDENEQTDQAESSPQEAQDGPDAVLEEQPAAQEEVAPVDDFEAGSGEIFQNAATYRANCRSLLPPTLSRNGGKHRNGFLRIQFLAIPSEGKRH